jgi:exodeoxyribonuclease V alpha subunit
MTEGRIEDALGELDQMAVLSAHHQGPQSVDRWRRRIEDALDERFGGLRFGNEWYPGQPIMITSNDYTLDLYNGDIGVTVATDDGLRVAFDRGGIRTFPRSHIGDHATVHAMTIHKSQGSGFKEVVVALPVESSRLLTRELLYTAVTRASEKVTLIGDEAVIRRAVNRSVERASGLGVRLWGSSS